MRRKFLMLIEETRFAQYRFMLSRVTLERVATFLKDLGYEAMHAEVVSVLENCIDRRVH